MNKIFRFADGTTRSAFDQPAVNTGSMKDMITAKPANIVFILHNFEADGANFVCLRYVDDNI